ncbi:MAG: hypothetical protein M3Y56_11145 [Armatimonadota bacterium]|nr:hypothetical protein [Armatimonadota bacterium]
MTEIGMNGERIAERGETLYQQKIRDQVETPENIGKMVIIDVETGDYAVDATGLKAAQHLHDRHPGAELYGIRIGYKVAEALGGVLERTEA